MRRVLFGVVVLLAGVLVGVVGCGGDESASEPTTGASASETATTPEAAGSTPQRGRWVVRDLGVRIDLETGDGGFYFDGVEMAINERGQVVGTRGFGYMFERNSAFLWSNGRLIFLPPLPGHTRSSASSINNNGQVVGISWRGRWWPQDDERFVAVIWRGNLVRTLGAPEEALSSSPAGINERGQVILNKGLEDPSGPARLWANGQTITIAEDAVASAINSSGDVVGTVKVDKKTSRPFLWRAGKLRTLATIPGYDSGSAVDINDRGQVVGSLAGARRSTGFLWTSGRVKPIAVGGPAMLNNRSQIVSVWNDYPPQWLFSQNGKRVHKGSGVATALSDRGQVAIAFETPDGNSVARLWDNGHLTRLPRLRGDESAVPLALNNRNQIAGLSCTLDSSVSHLWFWKCHAVMWTWQRS